jgi:hypothetical protein
LVQQEYKTRHDHVAKVLHDTLAFKYKLLDQKTPYYKYDPPRVLENEDARMYWDRGVITDQTIAHNRPDITVIDKKNKKAYLIDITVPNSANLQAAYTEKIRKYAELAIEVKQLWQMESVYVLPVVISATGLIPKNIHNTLRHLGLSTACLVEMQKAVILDTCSTVRKFLGEAY